MLGDAVEMAGLERKARGMHERDMLILEAWLLNRDIGSLKFRGELFTDAAAMNKWPEPAVRERALREFWNDDANSHFPAFREKTGEMSDEQLLGYRDQLQGALASRRQNSRLPSPSEICGECHRDEAIESKTDLSRKGTAALFAEWEHDYAARRAEDANRGLRAPGENSAAELQRTRTNGGAHER